MTKEIENPYYEFRNSAVTDVTKVELTDTQTILHIRCTYKPNWWIMIGDDATIKNSDGEQSYTIKSMDGGKIGAKLTTPACGYQDLVLYFDAVDPSITAIDLVEGGSTIFGIDLISSIPRYILFDKQGM